MRMFDIIANKRDGKALTDEEIHFFIDGYVKGEIPDYQVSALLMAIYFRGMDARETATLTLAMAHSGDVVDLSSIKGIKVDKHSTGGVGDKTTLAVAPMVAALGVKVAKMSGRGLGHTGGTIDKLESIPGVKTDIGEEEFFRIVNQTGAAVIGQSGNLVPADKLLYALRDVTATVASIPLIAASIMSKKLAAGSDCILLDVKTGSGAFMKTTEDASSLAKAMVSIGEHAGRRTVALISDMNRPLGCAIGNSLEVIEAVNTLQDQGPEDLKDVCISLAANMLYLAGKGSIDACHALAAGTLKDGSAFLKFKEMIAAQGGDISVLDDTSKFKHASFVHEVVAEEEGYISSIDTEDYGIASVMLGAGREKKEDNIDYSAGILMRKNVGDFVKKGDSIATLLANREELFVDAEKKLNNAVTISSEPPKHVPHILARVSSDGVERTEQ